MSKESEAAQMNEIRENARLELKKVESKIRAFNNKRRRILKVIQKNSVENICLKFDILTYDAIRAKK